MHFTATPTTGYSLLSVQFTDTSTGSPTAWSWDFGDGGTSAERNPRHTYLSAGTYTVKHSATNPMGTAWLNRTDCITVSEPPAVIPIVSFTTNVTSGYAPLAVKFTDKSTGKSLNKWNWSFGDGIWFNTTQSSQKNPAHVYTSQGSYTSRLTVCNASGCNTTAVGRGITVTSPLPIAVNVLGGQPVGWAINSAIYQAELGYNPIGIIGDNEPNPRELIRQQLSGAAIFQFQGHGAPGAILINSPRNEVYWAKNFLDYQFDEVSSYTDMDLAFFVGCNTGESDILYGNLVDTIADKDGKCAMGWTRTLSLAADDIFIHQFWDQISQGNTIQYSYQNAATMMETDDICISNHAIDPDSWTAFCNLDMLYQRENNNGCHVQLGGTEINQIIQKNSVQANEKTQKQVVTTEVPDSIKYFINSVGSERKIINIQKLAAGLQQYNLEGASFWIDSNSGRVRSMIIHENGSENKKMAIDLKQGYIIAES